MIYVLPNIPEPLSRAICADLIGNLPDPAQDTPEQRALRDERAITALAHYIPENTAEAELAADIVAAEFHAKDALRGALRFINDLAAAERCRRQHALIACPGEGRGCAPCMAACAPCCACRPSGTRRRTRCAPPPCCAPVICTAAFSRRNRNRRQASPAPRPNRSRPPCRNTRT